MNFGSGGQTQDKQLNVGKCGGQKQLNESNIIPQYYSGAGGPADCQDPEQELRRRRDAAAAQPGQLPQQLHAAGRQVTLQITESIVDRMQRWRTSNSQSKFAILFPALIFDYDVDSRHLTICHPASVLGSILDEKIIPHSLFKYRKVCH